MGCKATDDAISTSTSVTASSSATSLVYAVYPEDGNDQGQVAEVVKGLERFVNETSSVKPFDSKTFGLDYWRVSLNDSSAEQVRSLPGVRYVSFPALFLADSALRLQLSTLRAVLSVRRMHRATLPAMTRRLRTYIKKIHSSATYRPFRGHHRISHSRSNLCLMRAAEKMCRFILLTLVQI